MNRLYAAMATIMGHNVHSQTCMRSAMTTISLHKETKEMLRKLGSNGQTCDEVIRELMERAAIKELDEKWNRILKDEKFIPLDVL